MSKIGKITAVDLRTAWMHESTDFSEWLAENIDALSDALGMSLEVHATERKIDDSRYSSDILAEDENGDWVVIENQLEKTDHKHLGQIITYVTNMDAKTAVWITKESRIEHINAVNWLNQVSDKNFFLLAVKLIRIDESNPAPVFSVICRPSEEAKKLGTKKNIFRCRKIRDDSTDNLLQEFWISPSS